MTANPLLDRAANPLLGRALDAIPGYAEHRAALNTVTDHLTALRNAPPGDVDTDVLDAARDRILAGEAVPDDLGSRLVDVDRAAEIRKREGGALTWLRQRLIYQRDELVRQAGDPAFAALRDELDQVLDAVRAADRTLGPAATAEAAVRAGSRQVDAWRTLLALTDRYDEIRVAQRVLTTAALGDGYQARVLIEDAGLTSNLIPDVDYSLTRALAPWPEPTPARDGQHWPTTDRPAYLRWLTFSDAGPWLPTVAEAQAKRDEKRQQAQQAAGDQPPLGPEGPEGEADQLRRDLPYLRYHLDAARADPFGRGAQVGPARIVNRQPDPW